MSAPKAKAAGTPRGKPASEPGGGRSGRPYQDSASAPGGTRSSKFGRDDAGTPTAGEAAVPALDDLLLKYDKAGPRYTSYPTVPAWSKDFDESDYREALINLSGGARDLSVYLHLPFCAKRCGYCGCNSVVGRGPGHVELYLDAVERELELIGAYAGGPHRVAQLHWGGGTPNYLKGDQISRALSLFEKTFQIEQDAEISLEADPRLGTSGQALMLRETGFNRISLGVQDIAPAVQRAIGRNQSERSTREFYAACRDGGFESVNVDLVYGLPAQTAASFDNTLESVLELSPDRIACFSYAHVPWVRPNQNEIDAALLPTPEQKFSLFRHAVSKLTGAGYVWIGMDHFAKKDDELAVAFSRRDLHRNFMGYTTRKGTELLALGMSGISEAGGCFAQNDSDLDGYQSAVRRGALPVVRGHRMSGDDRLRRRIIMQLMCNMELPFDVTEADFGERVDEAFPSELERMAPFARDGLVEMEPDRIRVTETGRFFIRNICMEWDAYLEKKPQRPLFSRTV